MVELNAIVVEMELDTGVQTDADMPVEVRLQTLLLEMDSEARTFWLAALAAEAGGVATVQKDFYADDYTHHLWVYGGAVWRVECYEGEDAFVTAVFADGEMESAEEFDTIDAAFEAHDWIVDVLLHTGDLPARSRTLEGVR